jgi:hypothetical protein
MELSLPSLIGLLTLMGIVTKNSILLVEYIVMARREHGLSRCDAILDACSKRVRPILMTTIAMVAGMIPITIGLHGDSSFRAPMGAAVIGGLLLAALPITQASTSEVPPALRPGGKELVAMLAITGATAMALQVLWTRAISIALGPSTYAFSAIVCAYLLGLAFGGAVASRLADRPGAARLRLSIAIIFTGAMTFVGITWLDDLPLLLHPVTLDSNLTPAGMIRTHFLLAALSVVPATFGMGTIFPLTLGAVVSSSERLAAAVGFSFSAVSVVSVARPGAAGAPAG